MLLLVVICSTGDALFKRASAPPSPFTSPDFVAGSLIYALCGVSWVIILQQWKLATAGILFSVLWSFALVGLGVLMFRESLSAREGAGLVLGIASIYLLVK
ncbi:MAG: transporter [Nitrospirae bacterium]|nr:transporter [Nitrospirota bacterium]